MFARLALLFVSVTLIELYLLFEVSERLGSPIATVGLVLFTGMLGAWMTKQQGLSTLMRIQKATAEGRMPGRELVDGGMILFAGALLLTPGMLTDAFGFSLLMPPCRAFYRRLLKRIVPADSIKFQVGGMNVGGMDMGGDTPADPYASDPNVVEGTARPADVDEGPVDQ